MIRINLLPIRQLQAEVSRRREIIIGSIVIGVGMLVLVGLFFKQAYELSALNNELTTYRNEIQAINTKIKQLSDLQDRIKESNGRYKVIADLNKKKSGPVGVMESLAGAIPARLWLTEFKEIGGKVTMSGFAADNQTVADFLKALATTTYFRDVELVETTQGSQESGPYKRFSIRAMLFYLPESAAAALAPGAPLARKGESKS